jgi:hypothetical protein
MNQSHHPRPRFQFSLKLLLLLLLIAGPLAGVAVSVISSFVQQYRLNQERQAVIRQGGVRRFTIRELTRPATPPPVTPPRAPKLPNEEFPFANIDTTNQIPFNHQRQNANHNERHKNAK